MPITLGTELERGKVVTRKRGTLTYHNDEVPLNEPLIIAESKAGVVDLLLPDGSVVAIDAADMTGAFIVSELPATKDNQLKATAALVHVGRQPVEGEPIEARDRMLLVRTGKPFHAFHQHYVPLDTPLLLRPSEGFSSVFYTDTELFEDKRFPRMYLTTAYFRVLAQRVTTGEDLQWMLQTARDEITDRPIVWEDLEPEMTECGINPPHEIKRFWLQHLNDRQVNLVFLLTHLDRLVNLYAAPPSLWTRSLETLHSMSVSERRWVLEADPHDGWRRQLIFIGLVLQHRDQFLAGDSLAAITGLWKYRP
jgi:hypothetical protein